MCTLTVRTEQTQWQEHHGFGFPSAFRRSLGVVLSARGPTAQSLSQTESTEDSCWVQRQVHQGLTFSSTGVDASHPSGESRMRLLLLHTTL